MGRRVLAFTLMDQGHGNRCEGGSGAAGGGGVWWGVGAEGLGLRVIWWQ